MLEGQNLGVTLWESQEVKEDIERSQGVKMDVRGTQKVKGDVRGVPGGQGECLRCPIGSTEQYLIIQSYCSGIQNHRTSSICCVYLMGLPMICKAV